MISYRQLIPNKEIPEFESVRHRFDALDGSRAFPLIHGLARFGEKKVLDIGCSYGEFLIHAGGGSLGVTMSTKEQNVAKSLGLDVVVGDIQNPQTISSLKPRGPFQLIFANNLFEHLESPHIFLRSMTALATSETVLILGVPVFPGIPFFRSMQKFRGSLSTSHINFFSRDTLVETVERAGWKVVFARPFVFKRSWLDALFSRFMPHQYVFAQKVDGFSYPSNRLHEVEGRLESLYFSEP